MKTKMKTVLAAGLLAFGSVGMSQAQTVFLHVTGSTAFRSAAQTAIGHVLNSGFTAAYVGGSLAGASQAIFTGSIGSTPVVIQADYTGSATGIIQTANATSLTAWLSTSNSESAGSFTATTPPVVTGGTQLTGSPALDTAAPDATFADVFQASTPVGNNLTALSEAVSGGVGVVTFQYFENVGGPTGTHGINNVSNQLAAALFSNGNLPLSQFTGDVADNGTTVFLVGRSPDSGTRAAAMQEAWANGFDPSGHYHSTNLLDSKQFFPENASNQVVPTAGAGPITHFVQTPLVADPVFGTLGLGRNGFASGGNVAGALTATNSAANTAFVSYVGASDAATALAGSAIPLNYNGYSFTLPNVENGQYTFWSVEHLYVAPSIGASALTVATDVANQILTTDAIVSGDLLTNLHVSRRVQSGAPQGDFDGTPVF